MSGTNRESVAAGSKGGPSGTTSVATAIYTSTAGKLATTTSTDRIAGHRHYKWNTFYPLINAAIVPMRQFPLSDRA